MTIFPTTHNILKKKNFRVSTRKISKTFREKNIQKKYLSGDDPAVTKLHPQTWEVTIHPQRSRFRRIARYFGGFLFFKKKKRLRDSEPEVSNFSKILATFLKYFSSACTFNCWSTNSCVSTCEKKQILDER